MEGGYYLCKTSESRLRRALRQYKVILLGETLLLKFEGRLAAIALRDEGSFKKGIWYCPGGKKQRQQWRDLYKTGTLVHPYISGVWIPVRESKEHILNSVMKKASRLKEKELSDRKKYIRIKNLNEEKFKYVDG